MALEPEQLLDELGLTKVDMLKRIRELDAALQELTDACIAEFGDGEIEGKRDESSVFEDAPDGVGITYGMLRRARAALLGWKPTPDATLSQPR